MKELRSVLIALLCWANLASTSPQSNYAERGLDVEYQGNGLPQEATLDGIVTKLDDLSHTISTNRTRASLSCASRAMEVDFEFSEPFYGIVYADFSRQSACNFIGKGETVRHYEIPLTGCGTIQDPLRVFTNNIIVRFHPSLELEGDEVKTIVCRYPEPVVPLPLGLPNSRIVENPPAAIVPERLAEPQILLMICALLFLAMMLFGVACSYFCLKQRNIKLIRRRRALSSGPGSEYTGFSEQTIFVPPFEGLKIPRARTNTDHSDTLPSDYPSESRSGSEMEEGDVRSFQQESDPSVERQIVVPPLMAEPSIEDSSVYSDAHNQLDVDTFGLSTVIPRVDPSFDVAFRVKERRRSPAPSSVTSNYSDESRSTVNVLVAQERALTTILEREEWRQTETNRLVTAQPVGEPPLDGPVEPQPCPPPGYASVKRKPRSVLSQRSIPENETWSINELEDIPDGRVREPSPARSLESQARSVGEMILKSSRPFVKEPEASFRVTTEIPERHTTERTLIINEDIQLHTSTFRQLTEEDETETMIVPTPERPVPPPKLSTQEVDDVYLKTITETRIIDEEERIRRQMTEYHQRPKPPPPNWDVAIRTRPPAPQAPRSPSVSTNWDDVSLPPANWDVTIRQYPPVYEPRSPSQSTNWDGMSQMTEPQPPQDWDVTIRQYPPVYEPRTPSESTNWDGMSQVEQQPPPDWDVKIRQYPPVYEPRTPSESTNWDGMSQVEQQPPPDWDVKIRQYPPAFEPCTPSESTNWDGMSQMTEPQPPQDWDVKVRQYPPVYEPRSPSESTNWDVMSQQAPSTAPPPPDWDVKVRQYPPVHPARTLSESTDWTSEYAPSVMSEQPPVNWDVLIRVLNPVPIPKRAESTVPDDDDDVASVLTIEDRQKWHQIITTESTLRSMLTEAVVREDFERIRRDTRFTRIFEPKKWDVIIRVLAPPPHHGHPDDTSDTRSETTINSEPDRRRDPRSRGSSLAPVHESYDINRYRDPDTWSESSANTFHSSVYPRSTADRSMHSEMVERPATYRPDWDILSDGSMSRPSLARSTSEFTEEWQQRLPYDRVSNASENYSYSSSNRRRSTRPVLERSSTEVIEQVPQHAPASNRSSTSSGAGSTDSSRDFNRRVPYERVPSSSGSEGSSRPQ